MSDWRIIEGMAEDVLPTLPENSVHALVTDPPASIRFMGKKWDSDKGGRGPWVQWLTSIMALTRRPLVPGAYGFVWALPRRSHWTGWAVESAGYEICDVFHNLFGTGMPKGYLKDPKWKETHGTGLKPVMEHWWIGRNPLEGATADNLNTYGTGAFNVDACRVGTNAGWSYPHGKGGTPLHHGGFKNIPCEATKGRYPPHIALMHAEGCQRKGTKKVKTGKAHRSKSGGVNFGSETRAKPPMVDMTYANEDGTEDVENWECVPGCPIGMLGDPTRFWPCFRYEPKAPFGEKNAGCEGLKPRDWREGTKSCTPRSGHLYEHVGRKGKPRPNNHPCLRPGSHVLTDSGWVRIDSVQVGERVYSADGRFHMVTDVSSHQYGGPLYRVRIEGTHVDATNNHPFLVWRDGTVVWVEASQLRAGDFTLTPLPSENARDTVKLWADEDRRAVTRAGLDTRPARDTTAGTTKADSAWSTFSSGRKPTDQSRTATAYITKTATSRTTSCPTSNVSMPLHTSGFTPVANCEMGFGGSHAACAVCSSPLIVSIGISPEKDGLRTGVASPATEQRSRSDLSEFALHRVESIKPIPYDGPVWNLTVEGSPTFQTRVGMSHNTVKSVKLMRWIIRLICPPGGTVVDTFNGSGTTGVASILEGRNYIGIEGGDEDSPYYCEVSRRRMRHAEASVSGDDPPDIYELMCTF